MIKRINRIALAAMRDVAIVWSSEVGDKKVSLIDIKTMRHITPNSYHFHAIEKMQHCYSMVLVAAGVEPSGSKYLKTERHVLSEPRKHTGTIEYFNDQHERLLDSINPKHGKQAAWIATIEEHDFTDEQIIKLTGI